MRAALAETHQRAALACDVPDRHTSPMTVLEGRSVDRRQQHLRLHFADAREGVLQYALLHRNLRARLEVLQAAAPAALVVRTGWVHALAALVNHAYDIG